MLYHLPIDLSGVRRYIYAQLEIPDNFAFFPVDNQGAQGAPIFLHEIGHLGHTYARRGGPSYHVES